MHFSSFCLFSLNTKLTNFSTEHLMMCKVYTDVDGIKYLFHVCPSVRKINPRTGDQPMV